MNNQRVECPLCHRPMKRESGRVVEREVTGLIVYDTGPRYRCVNPSCPHRLWVKQGDELVPAD